MRCSSYTLYEQLLAAKQKSREREDTVGDQRSKLTLYELVEAPQPKLLGSDDALNQICRLGSQHAAVALLVMWRGTRPGWLCREVSRQLGLSERTASRLVQDITEVLLQMKQERG